MSCSIRFSDARIADASRGMKDRTAALDRAKDEDAAELFFVALLGDTLAGTVMADTTVTAAGSIRRRSRRRCGGEA